MCADGVRPSLAFKNHTHQYINRNAVSTFTTIKKDNYMFVRKQNMIMITKKFNCLCSSSFNCHKTDNIICLNSVSSIW